MLDGTNLLRATVLPEKNLFQPDEDVREIAAEILLTPGEIEEDVQREIYLLLDVSTSLKREINQVKEAAIGVIDTLPNGITVCVIRFSDDAKVIVEKTELTEDNRSEIKRNIERLGTIYATNISGALRLAMEQMNFSDEAARRVILFTDGDPTMGDTPKKSINLVREANEKGKKFQIDIAGLGNDWKEDFAEELTGMTSGTVYYVAKIDELKGALAKQAQQVADIAILDSQLLLKSIPGCEVRQLWLMEPTKKRLAATNEAGNEKTYGIGAIGKGQNGSPGQRIFLRISLSVLSEGMHRPVWGWIRFSVGKELYQVKIELSLRIGYGQPMVANQVLVDSDLIRLFVGHDKGSRELQSGDVAKGTTILKNTAALATRLFEEGVIDQEALDAIQQDANSATKRGALTDAGRKPSLMTGGLRTRFVLPEGVEQ